RVLDGEHEIARLSELLVVRELRRGDLHREVSGGLGCALALAAAAARHADTGAEGEHREPNCDPRFRTPESPPAGVSCTLPQGAGNIPPGRRLICRFPAAQNPGHLARND